MTLKSLSQNQNERKMIWCLDEKTLDKALDNPESRKILDVPNITIIQLPISDIEIVLNPTLAELQQGVNLIPDAVLVLDENKKANNIGEQYITIDKAVKDFFDYNIELARSYSRFCACLGAKSFIFNHSSKESSERTINASFNVDGMVNKITDLELEINKQVKDSLDQILAMSNTFRPDDDISKEERIEQAKKIMKYEGLENDPYCQHILKTFTECFTQLTTEKITLNRKNNFSNNLNTIANIGLKLPNSPIQSADNSIISFKTKLDVVSKINEEFNLMIEVQF